MINIGKTVVHRTRMALAERMLEQALGFVGKNPDVSTRYLMKAFDLHTQTALILSGSRSL